jgi:hypothetical protein
MSSFVKYRATQGIPWQRLIVVRDRRTRRIVRPIECWARIKTNGSSVAKLNTEITSEGAILVSLTADQTRALPEGDLEFDVMAKTYKRQSLVYGSLTTYPGRLTGEVITQPVAKGIISVSALNTITSLDEESQLEIRFWKGQDYRLIFSWKDEAGNFVDIKDAYMQAKDADGNVVVNLKWYPVPLSEAEIIALPNGNEKGYLAPAGDGTLELHISDKNSVPPGVYHYDIFVQEISDDWAFLVGGTLVVEESVSTRHE